MSILPSVPGAKKRPGDKRPQTERALAMCARICEGVSVGKASKAEGLDKGEFLKIVRNDAGMEAAYRAALATKAEHLVASLAEQADLVMAHAKKHGPAAGSFVTAFGHKVKVIQWSAEREAPKVYGAKVGIEHSGSVSLVGLIEQSMKPQA